MQSRRSNGRPSRFSSAGRTRVLRDVRGRRKASRASQFALTRMQGVNRISNTRGLSVSSGFPRSMRMNLKFSEYHRFPSVGGVVTNKNIKANNLIDPLGQPHVPMYHQNMMSIYNHYVVLGAKITVSLTLEGDSVLGIRAAMFRNDDNSTSFTSLDSYVEQPSGVYTHISNTDAYNKVLRGTYSARKLFGENPQANAELKCGLTTPPLETVYWSLGLQGLGTGVVDPGSVAATVNIEYSVVYFEPHDIAKQTSS